ncbi:MAG: DsbA family protein, partial [Longimicrobiales bacterium]
MPEQRLFLFADYVCPFCRLAEAEAARLRLDGRMVEGAAFELRPAGTPLVDLDAHRMREYWTRTIEPLAEELGVTMTWQARMTRTRKAHEAAAYARSQGKYTA